MTTQWHEFKDPSDLVGAAATIRRNYPHAVLEVSRVDAGGTHPARTLLNTIAGDSGPALGDYPHYSSLRATIRRVGTPQRRGVSPIDEGAERWVDGLLTGWRIAAEGS